MYFKRFNGQKSTKKVSTKLFLSGFVDIFFQNTAAIFLILFRRVVSFGFFFAKSISYLGCAGMNGVRLLAIISSAIPSMCVMVLAVFIFFTNRRRWLDYANYRNTSKFCIFHNSHLS